MLLFGALAFISPAATVTISLPLGTSAICNPLDNGGPYSADALLQVANGMRDGDRIYLYDNLTGHLTGYTIDSFWPSRFANVEDTAQVPPPVLKPGVPFFYINTSDPNGSVTFTGTPISPVFPPTNYSNAVEYSLLGCQSTNPGTYQNIIGTPPANAAQVLMLKPNQQLVPINTVNYSNFTFWRGVWTPREPILKPGEAAFFSVKRLSTNPIVAVWCTNGALLKIKPDGSIQTVTNLPAINGYGAPPYVPLTFDIAGNLYAAPNDKIIAGEYYLTSLMVFHPDGSAERGGFAELPFYRILFDQSGVLHSWYPDSLVPDVNTEFSNWTYDGISTYYKFAAVNAFNTIVTSSVNNTYSFGFSISGATDIAVNQTNIFISSTDNKIFRAELFFSPPGDNSALFADASSGLSNPKSLALDANENLYVANAGNGTVEMFTADGSSFVVASGLSSPAYIATYPSLNHWLATRVPIASCR